MQIIAGSIDNVAHNILLHAWSSKLWLNTLNWVLWILHDDVAYHDPTLLLQYYGGFGTNYIFFQMMKISNFVFFERTTFWEGKWKICWNIQDLFFFWKKLKLINIQETFAEAAHVSWYTTKSTRNWAKLCQWCFVQQELVVNYN